MLRLVIDRSGSMASSDSGRAVVHVVVAFNALGKRHLALTKVILTLGVVWVVRRISILLFTSDTSIREWKPCVV